MRGKDVGMCQSIQRNCGSMCEGVRKVLKWSKNEIEKKKQKLKCKLQTTQRILILNGNQQKINCNAEIVLRWLTDWLDTFGLVCVLINIIWNGMYLKVLLQPLIYRLTLHFRFSHLFSCRSASFEAKVILGELDKSLSIFTITFLYLCSFNFNLIFFSFFFQTANQQQQYYRQLWHE